MISNTSIPTASQQEKIQIQSAPHSVVRPLTTEPVITKTEQKGTGMKKIQPIIIGLIIVLFGIGSGYGLATARSGGISVGGLKNEPGLKRDVSSGEITVGTKVGVSDETTFDRDAEGTLEKGGIDGEGSHHLVRVGGESQTVYMTSSIIDLDQFIGRKVKIWGETIGAEKAGWFMDVGKLEVLE